MHEAGTYTTEWTPTLPEAPTYVCRGCGSGDVWYRRWVSGDGGHKDTHYECHGCQRGWWVEGADA